MVPSSVVILVFGIGGFVLLMAAVAHGSGQGAVFSLCLIGIAALGLFSKKRESTEITQKELSQAIKAVQENTPTAREGSQTTQAIRRLSPEHVAEEVAQQIAAVFSSSYFMDLFKDQRLSQGWSLGDALTIWYSLGNLALVIATWSMSGWEQSKKFRIIDHGRLVLLGQWGISESIQSKLIEFINDTEGSAVTSYSKALAAYREGKGSAALQLFFRRYVSCILGNRVEFSERSTFEDLIAGVEYGSNDSTIEATISRIFTSSVHPALKLLRESPIDWNVPVTSLSADRP